jgi:hypothetical protein
MRGDETIGKLLAIAPKLTPRRLQQDANGYAAAIAAGVADDTPDMDRHRLASVERAAPLQMPEPPSTIMFGSSRLETL